ncbi:MAG: phospho-N-acetylmuramoyl-pentapeptide-transferase [Desulfobacterota bacterium]|nr:phospho-N-acetylmuramoyl-pentapeptide-transferase [Thermodesulfobacteriota bacterium]
MLYLLLYPLHEYISVLNVFRYITFRTIYATVTALILTLVLMPPLIRTLRQRRIGQHVRDDGPATHLKKTGTPTGGGLLILFSVVVATGLWADLTNQYVWVVLFSMVGMGAIGFLDDWKKLSGKSSRGLQAREKFILQLVVAAGVAVYLYFLPGHTTNVTIPFFKRVVPDLGIWYIPFVMLVITGASNAVNLTDGLDGLAIGLVLIVAIAYLLFAYSTGHAGIAQYLKITFVSGAGELTVFCGALVGAGMGFLWYNTHPAEIFMGDVGSLALGGSLGTVAVITKHEVLLAIVGGVFVLEALSVIMQVGSFKLRRKRIFRMAPLHHHFELAGWAEPKVIVRFWIIGSVFALLALSTLKLR